MCLTKSDNSNANMFLKNVLKNNSELLFIWHKEKKREMNKRWSYTNRDPSTSGGNFDKKPLARSI